MAHLVSWIASSIRRKAIVGLLAILLSAVFLTGFSIVRYARAFILSQMEEGYTSISLYVANELSGSVSGSTDALSIARTVQLVCADAGILYAGVMAEDGRVLASGCSVEGSGPRWSLPLAQFYDLEPGSDRHHLSGNVLETYRRVKLRDGSAVFLLLGFDVSKIEVIVSKITRLIAVNALIVYVVGLLVLIAAVNRFTRPLENLTEGLKEVGSGRPPSPVPVTGKDEVAALTHAFNTMIQDLNRTQEQVLGYQKHLEDMVQNRTDALNRANEDLLTINSVLKEANAKLMELDKLKSNFLGIATHELKTPLAVVTGYLDSLQEGFFGAMSRPQGEVVAEALSSCNRMGALISDMLDLTKIEAGRMPIEREMQPLVLAVEKVAGQMIPLVQKKRLTMDIKEAVMETDAYYDQDRIVQVLVNLVGNAIKFTPDGGTIVVSAAVPVDGPGGEVAVTVEDTGIGIEEGDLGRIFEEFAQVGPVGKEEGTGLGLAICRRIVLAHGGRIWAESKVGRGSRFTFTLPVRPPL